MPAPFVVLRDLPQPADTLPKSAASWREGVFSAAAFTIQQSHQLFFIISSNLVLNSSALFCPMPFNF